MAREVSIPGDTEQTTEDAPPALSLEEQIAALQAENAKLKAAADVAAAVVVTPTTPHGDAALAASGFRNLTVSQLQAMIDAGTVARPFLSALCLDGYWTNSEFGKQNRA